jgi:hypothetical protein
VPKTLLVFDYMLQAWTMWTYDFGIYSLLVRVHPVTGQEQLMAGTDLGHVVLLDQDSQANALTGNEHSATMRTMWLSGGDPTTYKKFVRLIVHHRQPSGTDITGRFWVDDGDAVEFTATQVAADDNAVIGSAEIGEAIIGGDETVRPTTSVVWLNRRGRVIQIEFDIDSGYIAIAGITIEVVPGKFRSEEG